MRSDSNDGTLVNALYLVYLCTCVRIPIQNIPIIFDYDIRTIQIVYLNNIIRNVKIMYTVYRTRCIVHRVSDHTINYLMYSHTSLCLCGFVLFSKSKKQKR